jgi:hypothetical protein
LFHLLDETLEDFLREEVPLPERQVDISFSAPDQEWGAKVSRPTVNLFLWDVRQNLEERLAGSEVIEEDGRKYRRTPPPRVDCRYLVTAWTSEVSDEHQLLGALLTAFLAHPEISPPHLRGPLERVIPRPSLSVASPTETTSSGFWSALGGKLKPGLDLVVTVTVDAVALREAGPAVEQYELRLSKGQDGKRRDGIPAGGGRLVGGRLGTDRAGAIVHSRRGRGVARESGEFVVRGEAGDEVEAVDEVSGQKVRGLVPETGTVELTKTTAEPKRRAKRE